MADSFRELCNHWRTQYQRPGCDGMDKGAWCTSARLKRDWYCRLADWEDKLKATKTGTSTVHDDKYIPDTSDPDIDPASKKPPEPPWYGNPMYVLPIAAILVYYMIKK